MTSKSDPFSLDAKYSVTVMNAFQGKRTPTPCTNIKKYNIPRLCKSCMHIVTRKKRGGVSDESIKSHGDNAKIMKYGNKKLCCWL